MLPDILFARQAFNRFNASIFGSQLPEPRFTMTKARTFHGKMVYRWKSVFGRRKCFDFEMRLSLLFNLPEEEWEDVVIHEMIHYYIAFKGLKDSSSHGPLFREFMVKINRAHGRHITVSARTAEEQRENSQVRAQYLCIAKFSDGRLGVAPVAKTRIPLLWNGMYSVPGVVALKWIGSVDPWFNRYPRAMKPKLYITSREELLPHLKGGMPLEFDGTYLRALRKRCSPDELLP